MSPAVSGRTAATRALDVLEAVLADAGDSAAHAAADRARVAEALEWLDGAVVSHVWSSEGEQGLLADVRREQPRLDHAAARLEQEHRDLANRVHTLRELVRSGASIALITQQAHATRDAFERHGRHGARLAFDAWNLDLGGDD